jgi:cold shock CspA family protein/peroxiredoxin
MLQIGELFPDAHLLDQDSRERSIHSLVRPSTYDRYLGFDEGYPLIVVLYRGPFCPRDQTQFRGLVGFQAELGVGIGSIVSVSVQPPEVQAAFRHGLGARWTFLSDPNRSLIGSLELIDDTEGEEAFVARPTTFVLDGECRVKRIYDGWFFAGRPSIEELRRDLREVMSTTRRYPYSAWTTPEVRRVRVPQQTWLTTDPTTPTFTGTVTSFDFAKGNGLIAAADESDPVFFNFTAIPGSGYRTIEPGRRVRYDVTETPHGPVADRVVPEPK